MDRFSRWTHMIDSEIDFVSRMLFSYWQFSVLRKIDTRSLTFSPPYILRQSRFESVWTSSEYMLSLALEAIEKSTFSVKSNSLWTIEHRSATKRGGFMSMPQNSRWLGWSKRVGTILPILRNLAVMSNQTLERESKARTSGMKHAVDVI
jgi:hypothetical protein